MKFLGFFFLDILGIVPLNLSGLGVLVWPLLVDLTFPLVGVGEHNVGHILALPPLDSDMAGPEHLLQTSMMPILAKKWDSL